MSAYDELIAGMVSVARSCVLAERIRRWGHAERPNWQDLPLPPDEEARKNLLLGMTPDQRELVARLLETERVGAVHDILADLEWRMTSDGLRMSCDGRDLGAEVRESLHGDFIGRISEESSNGAG
jgi:hypothetical protein